LAASTYGVSIKCRSLTASDVVTITCSATNIGTVTLTEV
jgi:hypothetical protein